MLCFIHKCMLYGMSGLPYMYVCRYTYDVSKQNQSQKQYNDGGLQKLFCWLLYVAAVALSPPTSTHFIRSRYNTSVLLVGWPVIFHITISILHFHNKKISSMPYCFYSIIFNCTHLEEMYP